jgi:histidinol-phosphate aminotransferase
MTTLSNINERIAGLQPYKPGKPVDELTRELGITDIVKLASNENPRGPGPLVHNAISEASVSLSRYPDGNGYVLKEALVERLGVSEAQLTLGNGSNDVLDLVARVAVEPGYEAIIAEHSFVVYRLAVTCCGGSLVTVPARDYGTDLDGFLDAVTDKTRVVFIANPNNPTGTWVRRDDFTAFMDALPDRIWVVLDEAYFEYVEDPDYPDGIALLERYPNLVVTRTFSKIHGLAALRVGYGVSSEGFADLLNRARQPFNVGSLGLTAAASALADQEFVSTSLEINRAGMREVTSGLEALGLEYIPSAGNFVSFDCGRPGPEVFDALLREGVIVRPVAEYGLPQHIRVSIGLPDENARFVDALKRVL